MNKYSSKEKIMFEIYDLKYFQNIINKEFSNVKIDYEIVPNNKIILNSNINGSIYQVEFKYNDELFERCYQFEGEYYSNVKDKKFIKELTDCIKNYFLIITKKEKLYCSICGDQIGWIFSDDTDAEYSIATYKEDNPKILFDGLDLNKCDDCENYFCDCCGFIDLDDEFLSTCLCDNCVENLENYYDNDDDFVEDFDDDDSMSDSEWAKSIDYGGYDTEDEFWEHVYKI